MDEDYPRYSCCIHCEGDVDGNTCMPPNQHTVGCEEIDPNTKLLCIIGNVRM